MLRTLQIAGIVFPFWSGPLASSRAAALALRLRGKIHVIVGTADTFYLDGSVRLLEKVTLPLRYGARFTYPADRLLQPL